MKKHIKIKIDDNLTEQAEVLAIAKQLSLKQLAGNGVNKSIKRIGNQLDVKELVTTITIERVSKEKPICFVNCNLCGCEYQSDLGKAYFHNYGGNRKKKFVCSDNCRDIILEAFGSRVSISSSRLKHPINFFNRN